MLKKIFIGLGIVVALVIAAGALGVYYFFPNEDKVLNFIHDNPDKAAILLYRNDTVTARQNPDKVMPLASTVKIIIAIEYAAQAAKGKINADELISVSDLDKFYVPNTDGNAHTAWLESVKTQIKDGRISIREVAKGMIKYSSNANTEWLLDQLGVDHVNQRIDSLNPKNHTKIHYIVSSLFVGKEAFPELTGAALKEKLQNMDTQEYIEVAHTIHHKLLTDTLYKKDLGDLSMDIQRIWSDNLPGATVSDYVSIMKKINSRTYFDRETQEYLDEVMEYILENPANKAWLEHCGMKGGSTAFVLTKALYATDKKGNKTELACFLNDLSALEMTRLQMSMNEFELKILTNRDFRNKVAEKLLHEK